MTTVSTERVKAAGWLKEANYIGRKWVPADDGRVYGSMILRPRLRLARALGPALSKRAVPSMLRTVHSHPGR